MVLDSVVLSILLWYTVSMSRIDIKTNNNIAYICRYPAVFCPKYRRKVLTPPIVARLKELMLETIDKWGQESIEIEIKPDHAHLPAGGDLHCGIRRLLEYIKGTSSRYMRQ